MSLVRADVEEYAAAHTTAQPERLEALAAATAAELGFTQMLSGPVVGRVLEMLVYALGARSVLEIGTFSGYSALAMAQGLPPGGRIVTCEVSEERAALARRHIEASPHAEQIELRVGDALETVAALPGPFDFVFIDADKVRYRDYYEAVLPKLAPRSLIAFDNMLLGGEVLDASSNGGGERERRERARAVAELNEFLARDERVVSVLLTVRDGVTLVRPR